MSAPTPPFRGEQLLVALTDAMVAFHERYHQRKPVTAKSTMLGDDLLVCVLGGVYTDVEKTLIDAAPHDRAGKPERVPERHAGQVHHHR